MTNSWPALISNQVTNHCSLVHAECGWNEASKASLFGPTEKLSYYYPLAESTILVMVAWYWETTHWDSRQYNGKQISITQPPKPICICTSPDSSLCQVTPTMPRNPCLPSNTYMYHTIVHLACHSLNYTYHAQSHLPLGPAQLQQHKRKYTGTIVTYILLLLLLLLLLLPNVSNVQSHCKIFQWLPEEDILKD